MNRGLLILWAILLFGSFWLRQEGSVWSAVGRLGSSVVLVVYAWHRHRKSPARTSRWIALGMTMACLGDFLMARVFFSGPAALYVSMLIFAVAFFYYLAALAFELRLDQKKWPRSAKLVMGEWIFITLIAWYTIVFRTERSFLAFELGALIYGLILALLAGCASVAAIRNSKFLFVALGAILIVMSDIVLALRIFNPSYFASLVPEILRHDLTWLLYGPGQALFVAGFLKNGSLRATRL